MEDEAPTYPHGDHSDAMYADLVAQIEDMARIATAARCAQCMECAYDVRLRRAMYAWSLACAIAPSNLANARVQNAQLSFALLRAQRELRHVRG